MGFIKTPCEVAMRTQVRHFREGGNPVVVRAWTPAFAGMTDRSVLQAEFLYLPITA
jgi:hypothetical protein